MYDIRRHAERIAKRQSRGSMQSISQHEILSLKSSCSAVKPRDLSPLLACAKVSEILGEIFPAQMDLVTLLKG